MITKEQFLERIPENEEYLNTLCKFNPELNTLYESYGMRKIAADLACEQLSTIKKINLYSYLRLKKYLNLKNH